MEMKKVLKIERDLTNDTAIVTCPNCDDIDITDSKELNSPYRICNKCFYVFPHVIVLTTNNPLPSTEKKFNFDKEKLKQYRKTRTEELLSFHVNEDDLLE